MKSTTKLKDVPVFLTILFLLPYFKLLYIIIIMDKSMYITSLDLISIFISLIFIGELWTNYFYETPKYSKRYAEVNLKDVLDDYNKLNTLADYKYKDRFLKLKGKIKVVNIIDKNNVEIELLSDDTYKVIGTTICPRSKYKKYIKKLNKDEDVIVGCFIARERNKIYLDIDYVFYNNENKIKDIKDEISCTQISFKENKAIYFFKVLIYMVTISLILNALNYNILNTGVSILILVLLHIASTKYGDKKVDIKNLSMDELLEDYNKSEEDADFKYNNKYVEIYGTVETINIIDDEHIIISFLSNYGYTVSCDVPYITEDCLYYIKRISNGDQLRMKADFFREDKDLRLLMWYIIS